MSWDLEKKKITLDQQAGKESSQILLEGDVIVPDNKPDIEQILRCSGIVQLQEAKGNEDRVNFSGELLLSILYQGKKSIKPINGMEASLPIEDIIHIDGIDQNADITLSAVLNHLDCKLLNDRKINIKAVITVTAEATTSYVGEIIEDINDMPALQTKKGTMNINSTVENKKDRFIVKEELAIPNNKPNIGEILQTTVSIADKDIRAMDGRVLVRGNLKLCTLYVGDTDDSILEVVEHEIPFNGYIDGNDITNKMLVQADLQIENKEIQPMADEDGEDRILNTEITIGTALKVTDSQEMELIEDAYYPGKPLSIQRETIRYPNIIGTSKSQFTVKETVVLEDNATPIMQIETVWANASIDDVITFQDKVEIQGVVTFEVLYIGENDASPIALVTQSVPFSQELEVKGSKENSNVHITSSIENVTSNMLSSNEIEVRATLIIDTIVTEEKEGEIITEIEFDETSDAANRSFASAVIYVVQRDDSLWSIAKQYNTTIEDILLLNDIENPEIIYTGQKLLILKKSAA